MIWIIGAALIVLTFLALIIIYAPMVLVAIGVMVGITFACFVLIMGFMEASERLHRYRRDRIRRRNTPPSLR